MENLFLNLMKKSLIFIIVFVHLLVSADLKIAKVEIIGNKKVTQDKLLSLIRSKKGEKFDIRNLHIDKTILRNFYYKNGFMDIWVDLQFKKLDNKIQVKFIINEGKRYYYAGYSINEYFKNDTLMIRKIFRPLKKNEPYDQGKVDLVLQNLENLYYDNGYPYVQIRMDKSIVMDSLIMVNVFIQKGPKVTIDEIKISGNQDVKLFVISREILLKKGDFYSRSKIQLTQKNLYSTGLFETVNAYVESTENDSTKAILYIRVSEKKMKYIGFKFGFSYEENISYGTTGEMEIEYGHLNLFRTGRSLRANVIPSFVYDSRLKKIRNLQNKISITYIEPWFIFPHAEGKFNIQFFRRQPPNFIYYDVWKYALSMYKTGNFLSNNFTLSYQYITNIKNVPEDTSSTPQTEQDILNQITAGNENILSLTYENNKDKRDNIIVPHKGYFTALKLSFNYSQKMSNESKKEKSIYGKVEFSWNRYQPFPLKKSILLASRIRVGYIHLFGSSNFIPVPDRFKLGGASSIRGYYEGMVGPVGISNGKLIGLGGLISALANVELRTPIWKYFSLTTFVDAGKVWNRLREINITDIKIGTGGGIAFSLEFIVFRIEYGMKVFKKAGEEPGLWHFGIGFAF